MGFRQALLLVAVLCVLAGCDDGTRISRVEQSAAARAFLTTAGPEGLAVDLYGAPFTAYSADAVVAALRAPPGMAQDVVFNRHDREASAAGPRLLLVFNRTDVVDSIADCRRSARGESLPVALPQESFGFVVTSTLCNGEARIATAHMVAGKTEAADTDEFARVMRLLMGHLFEEPS